MEADGSNQRNLTNDPFDNHDPQWSPDGRHVFYSAKVGEYWQIMRINVDGSGKKLLTPRDQE